VVLLAAFYDLPFPQELVLPDSSELLLEFLHLEFSLRDLPYEVHLGIGVAQHFELVVALLELVLEGLYLADVLNVLSVELEVVDAHVSAYHCLLANSFLLGPPHDFSLDHPGQPAIHVSHFVAQHLALGCDFFEGEGVVVDFVIDLVEDSSCVLAYLLRMLGWSRESEERLGVRWGSGASDSKA
jgi:hypothetical protein